jgi:hypothetical protein
VCLCGDSSGSRAGGFTPTDHSPSTLS